MVNTEDNKIGEQLLPHLYDEFAGKNLVYIIGGCNLNYKISLNGPELCKFYKLCILQNIRENYFHISILGFDIGNELLLLLRDNIISKFIVAQHKTFSLISTSNSLYGIKERNNKNIVFSGNVYLFTDNLSVDEEHIVKEFEKHNYKLVVSDNSQRQQMFELKKPDLFICHDSRDKILFVDDLHQALLKKHVKIWYDTSSLKVGDSLTEKIEEGIMNCRYGALVLSRNFLSNEKWAKVELQSFKIRQIILKQKIILPIWLDIDENDLVNYSPWLLDKKAVLFRNGLDQVVIEICTAIMKN